MNYGILSRNVIVKCLTLVMVMLFSYDVAAQEDFYYAGNKIKYYSWEDFDCVANIISSKEDAITIADKIIFIFDDTYPLSSSYGNFVEFQTRIKIRTSSFPDRYDYIQTPCIRQSAKDYSFVKNGSKLYLVKASVNINTTNQDKQTVITGVSLNEKMIGTIPIDLSIIGEDFKIISIGSQFLILNNGVIYKYDADDIKNSSSVSSPKADVDDSKTYSIDGMQVDTPHNGIFIKGNKKAFVK